MEKHIKTVAVLASSFVSFAVKVLPDGRGLVITKNLV